jgi:fatty-acyl-CoA synthase
MDPNYHRERPMSSFAQPRELSEAAWDRRPEAGGWTDLSPLSFLLRSAAVFPDRPATSFEGRTHTYGEMLDRVRALAGVLRAHGIGEGDRVAALLPNLPAMLEAHYAVPGIGAVLVPINTRLSPPEVGRILDHSGAKLVLVDRPGRDGLSAGVEGVELPPLIDVDDDGSDGYEQLLARSRPAEVAIQAETAVLSINYTSGTTGSPKGVMYTHRGAYLQGLGILAQCDLTGSTRYLWTLPMFHCHGWSFTWAVTAAGGEHVCLRQLRPESGWELLRDGGITHFCGAPTVLSMLLGAEAATPSTDRVRVFTGGAPPSPDVIRSSEQLGWDVTHLYGLTETYGPAAICVWREEWNDLPLGERARLKARQGVQTLVSQPVRVVDAAMKDVARDADELGEIVVRGNTVTIGYFRDPEETATAFVDGVFHTGDLAVMHPDGYVEIKDRAKDVIISGGENISSIEVEQALCDHPDVVEAAVVGVPDEKWGETPEAFVVLAPGAALEAEELRAFARAGLAGYKLPSRIVFLDELPTTSTGKVQKFRLRELAE